MGMFNEFASMTGLDSGYINEAEIAEEMERLEEMPAANMRSDSVEEMYVESVVANERNFSTIMMSIANEEFQYYINNGTEMVYEGARLSAFFDKIKDFLDKAWQKIKAIFEKALNTIKAWTTSDAKFVQKYGDKIKAATGEICKISDSYEINLEQMKNDNYSGIVQTIRYAVDVLEKGNSDSIEHEFDDTKKVNDVYTTGIGVTHIREKEVKFKNKVKIDPKELEEKLYKEFANGATTKEEALIEFKRSLGLGEKKVVDISGNAVVDELRDGKTTRNNIKIWYNDAKKCIAGIKKSIDEAKKEASKTKTVDDTVGSYSVLLKLCNSSTSLMSGMQSLQLQASKVYHTNCRTIARRVVSGKTYKESVEFTGNFADLLE